MKIYIEAEKMQRYFHIIISIAGTAVCCFISLPCAAVLAAVSALLFINNEIHISHNKKNILKMCDDIDRVMRNDDTYNFSVYEEGELSILSAEIYKMTVRLREQALNLRKDKEFLKESLEDIAHQIRTPLTSLNLTAELLREPDLTNRKKNEYIAEIKSLLLRTSRLIDTLLGLARIDAGAVKFAKDSISCRELIDDALSPILISLELKNISVEKNISGEPCFIGDKTYSSESLRNIIKNCMEHTPEDGRIVITAAENPIYTSITITDSGSGFSEDEIVHVFERFYRSEQTASTGFGIGLAFSRRIMTEQNGSIRVRNAPPMGAQFDIRIYKQTSQLKTAESAEEISE